MDYRKNLSNCEMERGRRRHRHHFLQRQQHDATMRKRLERRQRRSHQRHWSLPSALVDIGKIRYPFLSTPSILSSHFDRYAVRRDAKKQTGLDRAQVKATSERQQIVILCTLKENVMASCRYRAAPTAKTTGSGEGQWRHIVPWIKKSTKLV